MNACRQLMDYIYTHPKAVIHFNASDMILSLVSDDAYLVLADARICCATTGYTFTEILHLSLQPSSQMVLVIY